MPSNRLTALCLTALLAGGQAQAAPPDPPAALPGGSNYVAYRLDGCAREPYGVVNGYDDAPEVIADQLAAMSRAGQRRLRIGIFHHRGPDSGTVMDSTGGDLSPRNRSNLAALLAAVRAAGFAEVLVAFFPQDSNHPLRWTRFDEALYRENRDLIRRVRAIVAAAGLPYRIDLLNEGAPATGQDLLRRYATRLWADYTGAYGTADTVGFSLSVWVADRVSRLPAVYGGNPPPVFDVHLYGDDWNGEEYRQFLDAHAAMERLGYHQPWIIGEAYHNDPVAAAGIRRAITETRREVRYLTQWPLSRARRCTDVDIAPPTAYEAYSSAGF
ncbi:hypothetical protein FHS43_002983 [Streptosporangium becharense]|uniref:Uncharacterized protein n=1 Tax=Streptosporangium becharense TaxID=1816182 RepID=A0A7W9IKQ3_9ACTN|nr:hypothetical protein [Streptosporangium becharense]MBB2911710.1 hypothetical protein [Streptosporangium becharense]MBB5822472.1 hypothetical protein [Streptosporangium becharense]